jgi:3,5-epimerase/4-reductase
MRVLMYGYGWIGHKVCSLLLRTGHTVVQATARADSWTDVYAEVVSSHPTHVVCCVGRTHGTYHGTTYPTIDYLELPGTLAENIRDNLYAPIVLSSVCQLQGIHLTYFGTGCIFNESEDTSAYTEASLPNFFGSSYSVVKGYTDMAMHDMFNHTVLNLRIRMPITDEEHPRNFITKILNYPKICSIPNSMSVLDDLLPHLPTLMEKQTVGTLNFTNPGVISHNEILEMYKALVDPTFTWENFSIEEQHTLLLSKRSNNHLDTSKLETLIAVTPIKEAMMATILRMKKNHTK